MINKIKSLIGLGKYKHLLHKLIQDEKHDSGYFVFNTVRQYSVQMHIEYFMAFLLAKRGFRSLIILDDGVLNHWDSVHSNNDQVSFTPFKDNFLKASYTKIITKIIKIIYHHRYIKTLYISEILREPIGKKLDQNKYSNLMHDISKSSSRRYTSELDFWEDYKCQDYFKRSYENCEIFVNVSSYLLSKYRIKKLITSHGIYSTWGILFEIFKEKNIPSLVYSELIYREQYMLLADTPHQKLAESDDWKEIVNNNDFTLNKINQDKAVSFLNNRVSYKGDDSKYYFEKYDLEDFVIPKKEDTIVFGMFPNIVWDGDIEEWHIIFDGILDWVLRTIEIIKDTNNILVIRCHPSEAKLVTWAAGLEDLIRASIEDIHKIENIIIIPADFDLNIYKFVEDQVDIGLVYDGMIGMEMVHLDTPVITAGNGRYSGSQFSYEPRDFIEYSDLLLNSSKTIDKFMSELKIRKEKLNRFIYWYLYEKSYLLPILSKKNFFGINFQSLSYDDIGNLNKGLQRTLDILEK
jgi:hypothetical protein